MKHLQCLNRTLRHLGSGATLALAACQGGGLQLPSTFGSPPVASTGAVSLDSVGSKPDDTRSGSTRPEQARSSEFKHLQSMGIGLADIPVAQAYLDRLMQRVQNAGPQPPRFARVLIRPRLSYNAATTRNGSIVVDLGWLKSIDSEAELAALLAHEYGHIFMDHLGTKNDVGTMTHLATVGATMFAAKTGGNNYWSVNLVGFGWSGALMPSWSRNQEYDADRFAVDTTQSMGFATVPSVRAFLERIQSVETSASRNGPNPPTTAPTTGGAPSEAGASGGTNPGLSEGHPRIEERIARVQRLVEGRPRTRPTARTADEWRAVRESSSFRNSEEEYVLAAQYMDALSAGKAAEVNALVRKIDQRKPLRTAAAMTAIAWSLPVADIGRRAALLSKAAALPDASFMPFSMLAFVQRDLMKEFEMSTKTLEAALDRFDLPPQQFPDVIEFERVVSERINALPAAQRPPQLAFFGLRNTANMVLLKAKCMLEPEVAEACDWASLNQQQRESRVQAQKARETATANKMEQKVNKMFK